MNSQSSVTTLPYHVSVLQRLAEDILNGHESQLPRLTNVVVLLPEPQAAVELRRELLQQAQTRGHAALLGPTIGELRSWVSHHNQSQPSVLADSARELILVEALREHPALYGQGNVWSLADSLLNLFDELTLNQIALPVSLEDFRAQLAQSYGINDADKPALHREAQLVHTLWQAWHVQLEARNQIDRSAAYLMALADNLQHLQNVSIYLAGYNRFSRAECTWLETRLSSGNTHLYRQTASDLSGDSYPFNVLQTSVHFEQMTTSAVEDDAYSRFLAQSFDIHSQAMAERARTFNKQYPDSPVADRLSLFSADGSEEEAQAIALQVRLWLLGGRERIGIVTENRRQARRIRALLERAEIHLMDAAGWALSTTSAAATLERWLECLEEDFTHQALLDLLKSPFVFGGEDRQDYLNTVYRFEQDIVRHENVGRNLGRYREKTQGRQRRLLTEMGPQLEAIETLLERLQQIAQPFADLLDGESHAFSDYLQCLDDSLEQLGIKSAFIADAAGQRVLQELEGLLRTAEQENTRLPWNEFRVWLGRTLERFNFKPPTGTGQVQLMALGQSTLQHFDALVIASAERESLPGNGSASPFFNDTVRAELDLPTDAERLVERFDHFRRLLEAAPHVLISLRHSQDDEVIIPSPWVEALHAFHQLAYGNKLEDHQLHALLASQQTEVFRSDTRTLPEPHHQPAPSAPAVMIPEQFSASAYQQLMNCPYQFFAARYLLLEPTEAVREALQKSDYGNHVHRCLQAFHGDLPHLPGPFTEQITIHNRDQAIQLLMQISHRVFAADLDDNYLHRGWLKRWEQAIPAYIDWQMARETQWRVSAVEQAIKQEHFVTDTALYGKLDRIETGPEGQAIIDYKTGAVPRKEDVESGEAVQLPFYALLHEQQASGAIGEVLFLALEKDKVSAKNHLSGEALNDLKTGVGERLAALLQQLNNGEPLPAWGDEKTCNYCDMEGLCRKQLWEVAPAKG